MDQLDRSYLESLVHLVDLDDLVLRLYLEYLVDLLVLEVRRDL